jgi:hypothetical protein
MPFNPFPNLKMTNRTRKTSPATDTPHTPGPWRLEGPLRAHIGGGNFAQGVMVLNADRRPGHSFPIARVIGPSSGREGRCDPELVANADFIVRACNSHHAMADLLRLAANRIKASQTEETPGSAEHQDMQWVLDAINVTLADAAEDE